MHYLGAKIETGDYYREGKTEGLLNSGVTQGRTWDFTGFNFRKLIFDSLNQGEANQSETEEK